MLCEQIYISVHVFYFLRIGFKTLLSFVGFVSFSIVLAFVFTTSITNIIIVNYQIVCKQMCSEYIKYKLCYFTRFT